MSALGCGDTSGVGIHSVSTLSILFNKLYEAQKFCNLLSSYNTEKTWRLVVIATVPNTEYTQIRKRSAEFEPVIARLKNINFLIVER